MPGAERSLTEFKLEVVDWSTTDVMLAVQGHGLDARLRYAVDDDAHFSYVGNSAQVALSSGRSTEDLIDHLNDNPLSLMLDDWSRICGDELFTAPAGESTPFDVRNVVPIPWAQEGVDIGIEYADKHGRPLARSIQAYLVRILDTSSNDIVYWDHGSGETADFITISKGLDGSVDISLYHCKGAGGARPGNRVDDVYEVCGQATKSAIWCDLPRLSSRLIDRFKRRIGVATFVKGGVAALEALSTMRPVRFEMVVVQPGIGRSNVEPKLAEILGAAASHLIRAGHRELRVLGSA